MDGDTSGDDRDTILNSFRKGEGKKFVNGLFLTYKVGSEGLNLTEATHCVCLEPWWNNAVHNQAVRRCWRVGQTKHINVHNLYVSDSVEDKILDICKRKDGIVSSYLDGADRPLKTGGLDQHTMARMLGINL
jgi:SNF2 family DNA or RNA helicase